MDKDDTNIISGINIGRKFINPKGKRSQVIRAEENTSRPKVQIVGGDSDEVETTPPTIIIEKEGDRITRIMVKCPCGRHSELLCEYEEPEADGEPGQTDN